jgi:pilus assembly protein CpaB
MSSGLRFSVIALMVTTVLVLGMITYNFTRPAAPIQMSAPAPLPLPAPITTEYLVAAHPLPAGTLTRDDDFVARPMTLDKTPNDGFADTPESRTSLRGALIRNFMDTGSPVTVSDVLRPRDRGFIASVLRESYRAVSIGVDPISGVAGLIWPGDHVDILLTQDMGEKLVGHRALSETVMSDVRVIAIDQDMVQGAAANTVAGKLVRTVTLEVDPMQAQLVAVAATMGKLSLSIRSATGGAGADGQPVPTFGSDVSPALAMQSRAMPNGRTMTIYNGTVGKEVTFR